MGRKESNQTNKTANIDLDTNKTRVALFWVLCLISKYQMLFEQIIVFFSDVKRNEFLHKFLLKLDPRQHYFVSSLLTVSHLNLLFIIQLIIGSAVAQW